MRSLARPTVLVLVAAALAAAASGAGERPAARRVAAAGDVARQVYGDVLGRGPSAGELASVATGDDADALRVSLTARLLDSDEFRARVGDDAFVVGLIRAAEGRDPSLHELLLARELLDEGTARSDAWLAVAGGPRADESDAAFLARLGRERFDFSTGAVRRYGRIATRGTALGTEALRRRLIDEALAIGGAETGEPPAPTPRADAGPDPDYAVYYGYLHAHTTVSLDAQRPGSAGPFAAFDHARHVAGLDFLGLSDHAEFITRWPWNDEWELLALAADTATVDGEFVGLRGFEYSNPFYGHVNVFGTEDLTSTFRRWTMRSFYAWLAGRPDAAATWNHPGTVDWLRLEFLHLAYVPDVAGSMAGMEILTHGDDYDDYTVGYVADDGLGTLDEALAAGWRVGSVSAQDNHAGEWGTLDDYRTGVLATALTRDAILDAIRARRFFSTQDRNLTLSFRARGLEMGSVVAAGPLDLVVRTGDADGEQAALVTIASAGVVVAEGAPAADGSFAVDLPAPTATTWYTALVTQADGDRALSAPIWVVGAGTD